MSAVVLYYILLYSRFLSLSFPVTTVTIAFLPLFLSVGKTQDDGCSNRASSGFTAQRFHRQTLEKAAEIFHQEEENDRIYCLNTL